jgi:hypothetical protein
MNQCVRKAAVLKGVSALPKLYLLLYHLFIALPAQVAVSFGSAGNGITRTQSMSFDRIRGRRIPRDASAPVLQQALFENAVLPGRGEKGHEVKKLEFRINVGRTGARLGNGSERYGTVLVDETD